MTTEYGNDTHAASQRGVIDLERFNAVVSDSAIAEWGRLTAEEERDRYSNALRRIEARSTDPVARNVARAALAAQGTEAGK